MSSEKDKPVEPTHHVPATRASNPEEIRKERPHSGTPEVGTPDGSGKGKRHRGGL